MKFPATLYRTAINEGLSWPTRTNHFVFYQCYAFQGGCTLSNLDAVIVLIKNTLNQSYPATYCILVDTIKATDFIIKFGMGVSYEEMMMTFDFQGQGHISHLL